MPSYIRSVLREPLLEPAVLGITPLGFQWETLDPFLFCVHHDDAYPAGNAEQGPATSLAGRDLGQDFSGKDGWRMYHGEIVPGFPQHPHRGFETVTIVRSGFIDHSDSLGATARFGHGDTQWLTAGKGIVHAEMFPLRDATAPNPLELFQIWLNLPAANKFVDPYFSMLWREDVPTISLMDADGLTTTVVLVAGRLGSASAPPPPPNSWAARSDSDLAIWTIKMPAGAQWTLPAAKSGTNRVLYAFRGNQLRVGAQDIRGKVGIRLRPDAALLLVAAMDDVELLLLQGRPINEPVVQHGPFVMNSSAEIQQAIADYQRTQFGGWPWRSDGPVHAVDRNRFARHANGREEFRDASAAGRQDAVRRR
jgi:redox-sensitive bicupin YhaK (pirin superfamily)